MSMQLPFRQLVGAFFLLYALAYYARSDVGAIAAASALYRTTPLTIIVLFGVCGGLLLMLSIRPPMVALVSFILIGMMGVSAAVRAAADPDIGWSGVVAHGFTLALILRWAWRRAQEGTDD